MGFAIVLFQLIKLSLLQNMSGNHESRGALLQELFEFFVFNEVTSSGAFGKLSSAYFITWWLWHLAENGMLSLTDVSQVSHD